MIILIRYGIRFKMCLFEYHYSDYLCLETEGNKCESVFVM